MKRMFPAIWFGIIIVITTVAAIAMRASHQFQPAVFIVPLLLVVIGYFIMKILVFDIVDEVWDGGSELLVKNHGEEAHIPLANIINVNFVWFTNPNRITLTLRQPCRFGKEITFCPKGIYFFPFSRNPIANQLIERLDALRHP
ncbi:MAG: hypothetical protein WBR29_08745 [Gammaproteobacteria bacterium]